MKHKNKIMKKYKLTKETRDYNGKTLYRIKALVSFGSVKAGDLGGFIEKEENLSHEGGAWVFDNAIVCDDAKVSDYAVVFDHAIVSGNAKVFGCASVCGSAEICGSAEVYEDAKVYNYAKVSRNAKVFGDTHVTGYAKLSGNAKLFSNKDYTLIKGFGSMCRNTTFYITSKLNIGVVCGCFEGDLNTFRQAVVKTHKNTKLAKEYLMIADLMEYHFADRIKKKKKKKKKKKNIV